MHFSLAHALNSMRMKTRRIETYWPLTRGFLHRCLKAPDKKLETSVRKSKGTQKTSHPPTSRFFLLFSLTFDVAFFRLQRPPLMKSYKESIINDINTPVLWCCGLPDTRLLVRPSSPRSLAPLRCWCVSHSATHSEPPHRPGGKGRTHPETMMTAWDFIKIDCFWIEVNTAHAAIRCGMAKGIFFVVHSLLSSFHLTMAPLHGFRTAMSAMTLFCNQTLSIETKRPKRRAKLVPLPSVDVNLKAFLKRFRGSWSTA